MAKFKKSAAKKGTRSTSDGSAQAQAERLSKSLSESAQQIWLAGVGAFGRAQAEGTRLFEGLVKDGLNLEQTARKFAGHRADQVRGSVETTVGQARDRAADTWDRLEKVFEDRVQRALVKLGVPNRDDLNGLSRRVDTLTGELRRQNGAPAARTAPGNTPVRTTAPKKSTVKKATARKATAKKPVATKAVAKKATTRRATKAARPSIATPTPPVSP